MAAGAELDCVSKLPEGPTPLSVTAPAANPSKREGYPAAAVGCELRGSSRWRSAALASVRSRFWSRSESVLGSDLESDRPPPFGATST